MAEAFPRREEKQFRKSLRLGLSETRRSNAEGSHKETSLGNVGIGTHSWDRQIQYCQTQEKMVLRPDFFSRKKEQNGYKIVHFHTKFILSLGLQAALSY